ncbi:hypothetical protein HK100_002521 [Physocladia obscura]|uniref:NADP-dependent oxidoreductase domain-containing protein n=1 Tax=Physocladia obscura TaxID=109957 RepID=A0AAD5XG59_9FUNG|nr:hypothetical protein HK100_002521 [Physocladia obscura]
MAKLADESRFSRIGYGALSLTQTSDRAECLAILQLLVDKKTAFIDTTNVYGFRYSEELIGECLRQNTRNRTKISLCKKFEFNSANPFVVCGKPEYVKEYCDTSLKRFGVDCIDPYYKHRVDPDTPIENTVTAMAELVKKGKIRYIGLCEASVQSIRRAHKVHPIAPAPVEYSPWSTDLKTNRILDTCKDLELSFLANRKRILDGKYKTLDDFAPDGSRKVLQRFQEPAFAHNVETLKEIADAKKYTVAQLRLAWVCAQAPHLVAIQIRGELGAFNVVILSKYFEVHYYCR